MLSENIKAIRKAKGLSQEDLAVKVNVVRQTISKWEQGLSVPDADMLISLSDALATPVSALLGEAAAEPKADDLTALCDKLEILNLQLARRKERRRSALHWLLLALCAATVVIWMALLLWGSPYLGWDYRAPETAVIGVALHALEWGFVRLAPIALIGAGIGAFLTRKKR